MNAFTLLVAVVLSAQATDAGVNKATRALFAIADTPEKMLALGEERVRDFIKTIGLYKGKAKNVIALSERLIAEKGGVVPDDRDYLTTLPGVGRKTANVVLNMAFGQPTMAVDTHVFPRRQPPADRRRPHAGAGGGGAARADPGAICAPCASLADPARALHLHGAQPAMPACPVADLCRSPEKRV